MYQLAMMLSIVTVLALGFIFYHEFPLFLEARRMKRDKSAGNTRVDKQ
jgi:hypothetical protein